MRVRPLRNSLALLGLGLLLSLASCDSGVPGPQAGGGIGGTGSVATVASGPVTQFGSVFVSGTEFDNTNALYCIDHEPCSQQNRLKLGMVVLVNGTRTVEFATNQTLKHVAEKIIYEETVEGVVQAVAPDGLSLVVLGQVISLNQKTEIDPALQQAANPHALDPATVPGTVVEISGFVTGDGTILATLILQETLAPHYEIEGIVRNHVPSAKTFEIGALVVNYSLADISPMPVLTNQSQKWDGLVVFVQGDQWSQGGPGPYGARMTATEMKPRYLGVSDSEETEVEDFVTRVDGPGDFYMNNLHVRTSASTTFEGGALSDILVGSHLEVHGPLVGGIVNATTVAFEGETELQGNIAAINPNDNTLTLLGLDGLTIQFDSRTALSGQGRPRGIGDLQSGDHLQIEGRLRGGNIVLAKEVERSDPSSHIRIQGLITSAADPLLVLLGSTVDTTAIPESGFRGRFGTIGRSGFFAGVSIGTKVTLSGTYQGNAVAWSSASRGN